MVATVMTPAAATTAAVGKGNVTGAALPADGAAGVATDLFQMLLSGMTNGTATGETATPEAGLSVEGEDAEQDATAGDGQPLDAAAELLLLCGMIPPATPEATSVASTAVPAPSAGSEELMDGTSLPTVDPMSAASESPTPALSDQAVQRHDESINHFDKGAAVAAKTEKSEDTMASDAMTKAQVPAEHSTRSMLELMSSLQSSAEASVAAAVPVHYRRELGRELDSDEQGASGIDALSGTTVSGSTLPAVSQPSGTQLADDSTGFSERIHARVGSHPWATELGNKLTLLASKDAQSATLYLTPADLGPVQVRIDTHQDQASVWFTADQAETRSALEQSLPRLRELFSAQGMSLTDAGVFDHRHGQSQQAPAYRASSSVGDFIDQDALADTSTVRSLSLSLLDAYA